MAKMMTVYERRFSITQCDGEHKRTHVDVRMHYDKGGWNCIRGYVVSVTPIEVGTSGICETVMFSSDCAGFRQQLTKVERNSKANYLEAKKICEERTELYLSKIEEKYGFVVDRNNPITEEK